MTNSVVGKLLIQLLIDVNIEKSFLLYGMKRITSHAWPDRSKSLQSLRFNQKLDRSTMEGNLLLSKVTSLRVRSYWNISVNFLFYEVATQAINRDCRHRENTIQRMPLNPY